ncbi:hypothetical protein B0H17DRAFT_1300643 [Mycena rosella]|uniref:Uncharacterized protein n=1 Tax=Mycena rosella TaxID=1033263 RepID=A0AAD7GC21_MYCRO|nr:hypothetical protein B0H17DRAFT_1300643 [Mycena rosella]
MGILQHTRRMAAPLADVITEKMILNGGTHTDGPRSRQIYAYWLNSNTSAEAIVVNNLLPEQRKEEKETGEFPFRTRPCEFNGPSLTRDYHGGVAVFCEEIADGIAIVGVAGAGRRGGDAYGGGDGVVRRYIDTGRVELLRRHNIHCAVAGR